MRKYFQWVPQSRPSIRTLNRRWQGWTGGTFATSSRVAWDGDPKTEALALDVSVAITYRWQISDENGTILYFGEEATAAEARKQADDAAKRHQEAARGE